MKNHDFKTYDEHAKIYKALSHPTRLYIVNSISGKRCSVSELANGVNVDISTISRHLEVLRQAGIIEGEKESNQVFYVLKFKCVTKFFDCITNNFNGRKT